MIRAAWSKSSQLRRCGPGPIGPAGQPLAAEAGFPAATMNFWMGIEGPAKMPQAIVDKL